MLCLIPAAARADLFSDWWLNTTNGASNAWSSNKYELLVPLRTYHVPASYSQHNLDKYNEAAWGIGLEKYYLDDKGDKHSLFIMTFQESHNNPQPTLGYSWQRTWYWNNDPDNLGAGLGYSAILTFRRNFDYLPFPGILPVGSIEYQRLSMQAAWVPYMGYNNGNVFLILAKWKFELDN